jgi:Arc/MetJ-type ribon-helix-helix transcriptional regulator
MSTRPKRKVTYSLPESLVNDISRVVSEGAAPSYSAFVEEALTDAVQSARERALAKAFADAASDPVFLNDIEETMDAFRHVDSESEGSGS